MENSLCNKSANSESFSSISGGSCGSWDCCESRAFTSIRVWLGFIAVKNMREGISESLPFYTHC